MVKKTKKYKLKRPLDDSESNEENEVKKSKQSCDLTELNKKICSDDNNKPWVTLNQSNIDEVSIEEKIDNDELKIEETINDDAAINNDSPSKTTSPKSSSTNESDVDEIDISYEIDFEDMNEEKKFNVDTAINNDSPSKTTLPNSSSSNESDIDEIDIKNEIDSKEINEEKKINVDAAINNDSPSKTTSPSLRLVLSSSDDLEKKEYKKNLEELENKIKNKKFLSKSERNLLRKISLSSRESSPEQIITDGKILINRKIQTPIHLLNSSDEDSDTDNQWIPKKIQSKRLGPLRKYKIPEPLIVDVLKSDENTSDDESNKLTEKDILKLKNMCIKLTHDPPPQHFIEKNAGSTTLTKEECKKFEKYSKLKRGCFKSAEDSRIKKNWQDFCSLHNWNEELIEPFLHLRHNYRYYQSNLEERKKFLRFLGRGLNNRSLYSILNRFQVLYCGKKKTRYTPEEDEYILKFLQNSKIEKNKCAIIGQKLNRSNKSVWRRIKLLKEKNDDLSIDVSSPKKKLKKKKKGFLEV